MPSPIPYVRPPATICNSAPLQRALLRNNPCPSREFVIRPFERVSIFFQIKGGEPLFSLPPPFTLLTDEERSKERISRSKVLHSWGIGTWIEAGGQEEGHIRWGDYGFRGQRLQLDLAYPCLVRQASMQHPRDPTCDERLQIFMARRKGLWTSLGEADSFS